MTALTARLAPFALAGILALTACGGGAAPADPTTGTGSSEPGIATSCPEGLIESFAERRYAEFEVTDLDARDALDAVGLTTMSPAPSCFAEIASSDGVTYSIGFWLGAEEAFLDYVVDQMERAGYTRNIDEPTVQTFDGTAPEHPEHVLSNAQPVGGMPGVSDVAGVMFVTIEWETFA
jgi:hypothetical protein